MEAITSSDRVYGISRWGNCCETVFGGILDVFGEAKRFSLEKVNGVEKVKSLPNGKRGALILVILKIVLSFGTLFVLPAIAYLIKCQIFYFNKKRIAQAEFNSQQKSIKESCQVNIFTAPFEKRYLFKFKAPSIGSNEEKVKKLNSRELSLKGLGFSTFDKSRKFLELNRREISHLDLSVYKDEIGAGEIKFLRSCFSQQKLQYLHIASEKISSRGFLPICYLKELSCLRLTGCLVDLRHLFPFLKEMKRLKTLDLSYSIIALTTKCYSIDKLIASDRYGSDFFKPLEKRDERLIRKKLAEVEQIDLNKVIRTGKKKKV